MDIGNQKGLDINVDSLWLIGPRAKGGKRENNYHGNFVPQIPEQMIRRYTKTGGIVLDMFMGSGTTLFEAESLGHPYIGFDINDGIIAYVQKKDKRKACFSFAFLSLIRTSDATRRRNPRLFVPLTFGQR